MSQGEFSAANASNGMCAANTMKVDVVGRLQYLTMRRLENLTLSTSIRWLLTVLNKFIFVSFPTTMKNVDKNYRHVNQNRIRTIIRRLDIN